MRSRRRRASSADGGSSRTSSVVRRPTPRGRVAARSRPSGPPTITSRLPPPRSRHRAGPGSMTTLARTAWKISRASSIPLSSVDPDSGGGVDGVDDLAAVVGVADGAGGAGHELDRAQPVGLGLEPLDGGDGLGQPGLGDPALPADHVAQAKGLLVAGQGDEMAVGRGVDHQEVERVGSEVEGGDAHVPSMVRPGGAVPVTAGEARPRAGAEQVADGCQAPVLRLHDPGRALRHREVVVVVVGESDEKVPDHVAVGAEDGGGARELRRHQGGGRRPTDVPSASAGWTSIDRRRSQARGTTVSRHRT